METEGSLCDDVIHFQFPDVIFSPEWISLYDIKNEKEKS